MVYVIRDVLAIICLLICSPNKLGGDGSTNTNNENDIFITMYEINDGTGKKCSFCHLPIDNRCFANTLSSDPNYVHIRCFNEILLPITKRISTDKYKYQYNKKLDNTYTYTCDYCNRTIDTRYPWIFTTDDADYHFDGNLRCFQYFTN